MKLSAQQLKAIRRRRREDADNEAEDRATEQFGELFGLDTGTVAFRPPSSIVGWYHTTDETVCCMPCSVTVTLTAEHRFVYAESFRARHVCARCGRRLEDVHAGGR